VDEQEPRPLRPQQVAIEAGIAKTLTGGLRALRKGKVSSGRMREARPSGAWRPKTEFDGLGEQRTHIRNRAGPIPPGTSKVRRQMRRNRSSAGPAVA
jgi:hypothetical protein